jgi:hypothetical protein
MLLACMYDVTYVVMTYVSTRGEGSSGGAWPSLPPPARRQQQSASIARQQPW